MRFVIRKWLLSLRCDCITMVQPAESRQGLNLAFTRRADFCRPTCWRVLREPKMRPVLRKAYLISLVQRNLRVLVSRGRRIASSKSSGKGPCRNFSRRPLVGLAEKYFLFAELVFGIS